jgi:hypothetical protein
MAPRPTRHHDWRLSLPPAFSVPLAAPSAPQIRDHRAPAAVVQSPTIAIDHRVDRPYESAARFARPLTLADNVQVSGCTLLKVSTRTPAFSKLELRSERGRTKIDKVSIAYENGRTQLVSLNTVMNGSKTLTIHLNGGARNVKSITLFGTSAKRASLDVIAL